MEIYIELIEKPDIRKSAVQCHKVNVICNAGIKTMSIQLIDTHTYIFCK